MLAVGWRSHENRSNRGRSLSAVREDETWPRDLDHRGLRARTAVGRGGPDLLRWNRFRQTVRDAPPPRWAGRGPARHRCLRDGRGRHVAPRRRYRSDRPRRAGGDRILRREPHPPRRRHVVHPRDPRDPGRCGGIEGHREQSGRGQLLSPRGGAHRRPEPLRDRDPDRDGVGPRHGIRVAGGRGIHDDRRGGGGGHGQGIGRVPSRSPPARWRSSGPTASLGRSRRSHRNCSTATGSGSTDAPIRTHRTATRATGPRAKEAGTRAKEAGPEDRPNRRRDPARGSRGRSRRPPPRAPAVGAARPAVGAARSAVRLRHRSTSARTRGSRQPHGSDRLRCVSGSRIHRTTPMAILSRGVGVSVTGRRGRAAGPPHTRTTIPAGTP